jgi:hypothetical protein
VALVALAAAAMAATLEEQAAMEHLIQAAVAVAPVASQKAETAAPAS